MITVEKENERANESERERENGREMREVKYEENFTVHIVDEEINYLLTDW